MDRYMANSLNTAQLSGNYHFQKSTHSPLLFLTITITAINILGHYWPECQVIQLRKYCCDQRVVILSVMPEIPKSFHLL